MFSVRQHRHWLEVLDQDDDRSTSQPPRKNSANQLRRFDMSHKIKGDGRSFGAKLT